MALITCDWCNGTGKVSCEIDWEAVEIDCTECDGKGKVEENENKKETD